LKNREVDAFIKRPMQQIIEMDAADYSYENLRKITQNFHVPAVVRGLFKNTTACRDWGTRGGMSKHIGKHTIPVVVDGKLGSNQREKKSDTFENAFNDILDNNSSEIYLFFPLLSRDHVSFIGGSHKQLIEDSQKMVLEDLEINKIIRKGFGTSKHSNYYGTQFVVGRGQAKDNVHKLKTTGTGWHCAIGTNYFVQVVGGKRWYFMDPKYSPYMSPLRGGIIHMITGDKEMSKIHANIPLKYVDLEAGDMLLNPAWQWHTIENKEGISIGTPIREFTFKQSLWNNLHFTSIVIVNKILLKLGVHIDVY
jgi:hypothetical protein